LAGRRRASLQVQKWLDEKANLWGQHADGRKSRTDEIWTLEVDLEPFNSGFPQMSLPSSIGDGVRFLNRNLSSRLFNQTSSFHP
jgi:Sucrose synthase